MLHQNLGCIIQQLESVMNNDFCYGRDSYFAQEYGLKKPDKYILRVFPKAEYYLSTECWCLVFERVADDLKDDLENYTIIKGKNVQKHFYKQV